MVIARRKGVGVVVKGIAGQIYGNGRLSDFGGRRTLQYTNNVSEMYT